jgi:hypothetical protein
MPKTRRFWADFLCSFECFPVAGRRGAPTKMFSWLVLPFYRQERPFYRQKQHFRKNKTKNPNKCLILFKIP